MVVAGRRLTRYGPQRQLLLHVSPSTSQRTAPPDVFLAACARQSPRAWRLRAELSPSYTTAPTAPALAANRYHGTSYYTVQCSEPPGEEGRGVRVRLGTLPLMSDLVSADAIMGSWPPFGPVFLNNTAFEPAVSYRVQTPPKASCSNRMLWWAIERNDIVTASLLLGHPDFEVNLPDRDGTTGLAHAAFRGRTSILRLLLAEVDVDVNSRNSEGDTPLALAAAEGHTDAVEALLDHRGTAADSRNTFRATPLALAAEEGHLDIVKILLARGDIDADSRDVEGCSPLARAAAMGHEAIVRVLLGRQDVAINSRDRDGYTPLAWAARRGHGAVVGALMEQQDLDVHSKDHDGWTPLMLARDGEHQDVVRRLADP